MKHCLNERNDAEDIVLENDPIFDCEIEDAMLGDECVSVTETCDDENTFIIIEPESFPDAEIKFDETYIPHEEWINLMIEKLLIDELLFGEKEGLSSHTDQMSIMLAATKLSEEAKGITMSAERDGVGRDGEMKALLKEQEDKSKCGPLYKSNIVFCADIGRQEKATKFEEELKFLEAWLETPCLYEYIVADVQMIDTINSEKENSPIQPAIILRRARIRIQVFLHRGRNEVKIQHYLMAKKVNMKPHPQMKKYGLCKRRQK